MTTLRKPIALIGRIDPEDELLDGQTVKTRTLWRFMVEKYRENGVVCVDTRDYARKPLSTAAGLARSLATCDDFVVLLSRGGRRTLFPVLSLAARKFGKRVYHSLIGGKLADDIRGGGGEALVEQLNSFQVNWVESPQLVADLAALGVTNASYLPNFKNLTPLVPEELNAPEREPYRFCTFSRVCAAKGIPDAAWAISILNKRGVPCELDVYGPIGEGFQAELDSILATNPHVSYKGLVGAEESVEAIKGYAALLFPTTWSGEGFPGTVIDALAAGIPVIAYRWRYYDDILEDGVTGFGCSPDAGELAKAALLFARMSSSEQLTMKHKCLARAERYSAQGVFQQMEELIDAKISESEGGVR